MLCEKCKKMACASRNEALTLSAKLGIGGRHTTNGNWYPGETPQVLEDWCKKNCKPVKEAKPVKTKRKELKERGTKYSYYKPTTNKEDKKKD